jgi:hypothetical protein
VLADLGSALAEDGLAGVMVIGAAADPTMGPPRGVDELVAAIDGLAGRRHVLFDKLVTDLGRAASRMSEAIGSPTDYAERAPGILGDAAALLASGDTEGAKRTLSDFYEELAVEAGGEPGAAIARHAHDVPVTVDEVARSLPRPTRSRLPWRRSEQPDPAELEGLARAALEESSRPVAEALAGRARAIAAISELVVGVAAMRRAIAG